MPSADPSGSPALRLKGDRRRLAVEQAAEGSASRPRRVAAAAAGDSPGCTVSEPVQHVLMTADAVGGVWRYSVDLAAALSRRGVHTTLAVMGPAPSESQRREADRLGIHLVSRNYRLEWMAGAWGDVIRAGQWLLALERTLDPDVVHLNGYCHAALPWRAPALVAAHSCVRSWWRAVHGEEAPDEWDRYRAAVAGGLSAARLVVAPTAAMLGALDDEYGLPPRVRVIPNGLPAHVLAASSPAAKEPFVLAAGRLWDDAKNIEALCGVAADLPWPVRVAGDARAPGGDCRPLGPVEPLGQLEAPALRSWFARAAVYALPARYEPFGLSVLEAAACGCALVLGDIRSLRENWNGAARFVPVDNRRALATALRDLIADAEARTDLGRRAAARARQFTIDRTADAYLAAYEEIVHA